MISSKLGQDTFSRSDYRLCRLNFHWAHMKGLLGKAQQWVQQKEKALQIVQGLFKSKLLQIILVIAFKWLANNWAVNDCIRGSQPKYEVIDNARASAETSNQTGIDQLL